ncbi:hypothetical protein DYB35_007849 [Aphanomyces astaci]|uniref:Uncharacterized protein n=2 Tax=Aphanomyces astaci TaxID=112090 RepID=A0A418DGM8_APHAT|nr:hypothetical protein DYB35_007849 [Aphanomyces astaci]
MFGRRQQGASAVPGPKVSSSSRKNSTHFHAGSTNHQARASSPPPPLVEKKRTVSVHTSPLSPRRHRSASIDLTVLSEDSSHAHHILQSLDDSDGDARAFLEHARQGHATFHRVHLPGHELGFFAVMGPTHLVLWNSHLVHRAIAGKDSPAMHLPTLTTLPYPPEMLPLHDGGKHHVVVAATSFHNATQICALVITVDGRVCFWDDISRSSSHDVPVVTRLRFDDPSETVRHASPAAFPVIAATSTQTLWEIKLDDDDRSSLRVSKLRSRQPNLWSHVISRFLTSSTPSPILVTQVIPTSSELLVLHVDSTLTRSALRYSTSTDEGATYEPQWTFQLCGFFMEYFAQHEANSILVYARCLSIPLATPSHVSVLVGFQTGANDNNGVVLYLFEFTASMADPPRYRRSTRIGAVASFDGVQSVPVDDQSLYVVTPSVVFAISVPRLPHLPLHVHAMPVVSVSTGVGVLHQSLLYLHMSTGSVRQLRSFEWTNRAPPPADDDNASLVPDPKRYKVSPTSPSDINPRVWLDYSQQHRSLAECKMLVLNQFQQFDVTTAVHSHNASTLSSTVKINCPPGGDRLAQAVVDLGLEIVDAKPATGLHWGGGVEDKASGATSSLAPHLIKYQLHEKCTRYRHFIRFVTSTGLVSVLPRRARGDLNDLEEKLVAATTLLAYSEELSQVVESGGGQLLLEMMHAVLVRHRGYTTDQIHATGFSVLDLFYADVSLVDQLAIEWVVQGDTSHNANSNNDDSQYHSNALVAMLHAVERFRRGQDLFEDGQHGEPWTAQPSIRHALRRMLLAGDRTPALLSLVPALVPFMDENEKQTWTTGVLVPLVASYDTSHPMTRELVVDIVFAFEFLQGMAVVAPAPRLHAYIQAANADTVTFFFEWYAGLSQRSSTLSQYAWMVAVQLDQYHDVATCALADALAATSTIDAPLWQQIVAGHATSIHEVDVEKSMRSSVVYLAMKNASSKKAQLTLELVDDLVKDPALEGISIKARPLLAKTLALVVAPPRSPP